MSSEFPGFSPQALVFFEELSANNNKAWFEAHRADYETLLLEPLKELVAELAAPLLAIDPALQVLPPSRCIARIHRDIRFSRDKSPYKTHLWLSFKRPSPDWKEHPCFFFEIAADRYRYGMGFYSAPKATMDALRRTIETAPEKFRRLVAPLARSGRFVPGRGTLQAPRQPRPPRRPPALARPQEPLPDLHPPSRRAALFAGDSGGVAAGVRGAGAALPVAVGAGVVA